MQEQINNIKEKLKLLQEQILEIKSCRSLSQEFGGPQNLYPRKKCITKDCTREAPQFSSDLCGKCRNKNNWSK